MKEKDKIIALVDLFAKMKKKMFVTKTNLYKLTCYYNFLLF